ncbi:S41 family peptidase [Algoriphagus sp.]|uniref:S41 family peptidase n=1 Tax=Algoriphagus sp. TaxID=1872435 RepID=UPI003F6F9FE4
MKKLLFYYLVISSSLAHGQIPDELSNEDKIYGLSKFWQEVNYNYVYLDKVDKDEWDKQYRELISEVQNTENDYEYYRMLQRFCAFLKDGHTNVYFPKSIQNNIYNTNFGDYRLFLSNIEGKAIVTRVNKSKKDEIPIGSEIIEVNGMGTDEYLREKVTPFISSSTDFIREDWSIEKMLEGYLGTSFKVKFRLSSGETKTLTLTHAKTEEEEVFPPLEQKELVDLKWVGEDVAHVSLNSFSDWQASISFQEMVPKLKKANALIIDLRNNGGGNTNIGMEIFKYLTNDTILYGATTQSRLHVPAYKAWGKWTQENDTIDNSWAKQSYLSYRDKYYYNFPYTPDTISRKDIRLLKKKKLIVPTVILIGHGTASAAEDFLIYADNQNHMTKIGEPTFGSTGQPMIFDLPNGGIARVCTKKDTYPDGREFVGVGIQPDIFVTKSLADYLENRDPVLEKAIEFLKSR